MEAVWITLGLVVAVFGGWPVTAGILRLARSKPVRAVDAAESGDSPVIGDTPAPENTVAAEPVIAAEAAHAPAEQSAGSGATTSDGAPRASPPPPGVLRGGLLIGFLERAGVAVAIFSGQPVAIAYIVAIKGLGRYPELKATPAASERFIIGTLASMLWAAGVVTLTKVLLL